jgi:hypothetical protein
LEIIRHGEVIKSVEPSVEGQAELKLELELEAGMGFWIAAHAVGSHGEQAHTTPVYVVRPRLRFWKHAEMARIVRKSMVALDEVEQIVAVARQQDAESKLEDNRTHKQLAIQGPALLERVTEARKIWRDLKATAAQEEPLRAQHSGNPQ